MEILTRATLDNLQLDVKLNFPDAATFIGLSGPSGAGKTTLLRCLAGLSKDAEASGRWGQHVIGKVRTGLVFQDSLLFPHLSVGQNLLLAADFARQQSFHFDEVVLGCKCNHLITRMPDSLSGGEAQRVAIARAILNSPSILLLDEPVSAMDNVLKHDVLKYLASLSRTSLKMLMVSHDLRELALYTDHMAWLERGTVIYQGQTDSVMSDLTVSLPGFEQRFTVFRGVIEEHLEGQNCYALRCEGQLIYARNPVVNGKQALLTIDARDISIDREQASASSIVNGMTCTVGNISKARAGQLMFTLSTGSTRIFALISQLSQERLQFQQGETVTARFKLR